MFQRHQLKKLLIKAKPQESAKKEHQGRQQKDRGHQQKEGKENLEIK